MAGAYDQESTPVTGTVEVVDLDTLGTGTWKLAIKLRSPKRPAGYQVTTAYSFSSSFSAVSACRNAAAAFGPAVQDLLGKAVDSPEFATLWR